MPVGVPKVYIVYDSKGNIELKGKKKRFDDDGFGQKFDEEFGDNFGFGQKFDEEFGDNFGSDVEDEEEEDEEGEGTEPFGNKLDEEGEGTKQFGKKLENGKMVGQHPNSPDFYLQACGSQKRERERERVTFFDLKDDDNDPFKNDPFKNDPLKNDPFQINPLKIQTKEEQQEGTLWHDLFEVLYREGVIFVGREMTMKFANTVVSLMVYLDREDKPNRTPTLFINSPGGFVFAGLAIYDTMDLIRYGNKVQTLVIGIAASMASVVLIGGGIRVAFTHAKVMIHQPRMKPFEDESSEIALEARVLLDLRHSITEIYERKTTRPYWAITLDLERDKFMTAIEARDYGIVDKVAPGERDDDVFGI